MHGNQLTAELARTQHLCQPGAVAAGQPLVFHGPRPGAVDVPSGPAHRVLLPVRAGLLGAARSVPSHGAALRTHHGARQSDGRVPYGRLHGRLSAVLRACERVSGRRRPAATRHADHVDRLHSPEPEGPCGVGERTVEQYAAAQRPQAAGTAEAVRALRVSDGGAAVSVDVLQRVTTIGLADVAAN